VSHIRLATHLIAALLIYGVLIWTALDLLILGGRRARLKAGPALAILALVLQLILGAFTAGLRAGYAFASWPKMGDDWFPQGGWASAQGMVHNLVSNPIVVQFTHRWWAWVVAVAGVMLAARARRAGEAPAALALVLLIVLQIGLGIATLLSGVDLALAVTHQAVAALLLAAMVWAAHAVGRRGA
jgi:cytochrome c oxidase assembly protein subunit 15